MSTVHVVVMAAMMLVTKSVGGDAMIAALIYLAIQFVSNVVNGKHFPQ